MPLKNILIIACLFLNTIASATDYYISSTGNDANNGLSASTPWNSIAKVNSSFSILKPGDAILFKRGEIFYGTITINKSGSIGSPITIGAYGTGENPVITGFTTISGWTNEGNGIYSKVIASAAQTNMVTIDGVNTGMGRYPNSTYLTYESFSTNVSITDVGLGDATDWAGAEVVIKKNNWTLDRCIITDHSGDKITYTSLGSDLSATANYGYFIQNDLRCVDSYGEWYHNTSTGKFYMFFGTVDPATKLVKVSTINNLLYNYTGSDYIKIENLSFIGSINSAVDFSWGADHCTMQNCSVSFAGEDGIRFSGNYGIIDNNTVHDCNRTGIGTFYNGTNTVITNNTITNIGLVKGLNKSVSGVWSPMYGIAVEYNNCLVQYNTVENVAYIGIGVAGAAANGTIQNNSINNACLILNDGGGIYTGGAHTSLIIDGNIVLNSLGNIDGSGDSRALAEGIFLDVSASNVYVRNNTVANCSNSGIKLNRSHDNTFENNTTFNNFSGIIFENWTESTTINNENLTGNIFFAKASTQFSLRIESQLNDITGFGTADNNYYARPIDDSKVFYTYQPSTGSRTNTLAEWRSFMNQDADSHKSPISITNINDIRFEYNASKTNKVITLDQPMLDVKGTKYSNSITLLPYTSVVLMVDPNPSQPVIPVCTGSVIENATPSTLEMTYNVSLANITPAITAFTVRVNSVNRSVSSAVISGNKVLLALASKVVFNDNVTISYIKPVNNFLQTASGGAAAGITSQPVTNNCLNIATSDSEDKEAGKVFIYPNPAHDFINISIEKLKQTPRIIKIIDSLGKVVFQNKINPGINLLQIPLHLIQGLYFVQLCSEGSVLVTDKLVVTF